MGENRAGAESGPDRGSVRDLGFVPKAVEKLYKTVKHKLGRSLFVRGKGGLLQPLGRE